MLRFCATSAHVPAPPEWTTLALTRERNYTSQAPYGFGASFFLALLTAPLPPPPFLWRRPQDLLQLTEVQRAAAVRVPL